jgi:hypothetical protein
VRQLLRSQPSAPVKPLPRYVSAPGFSALSETFLPLPLAPDQLAPIRANFLSAVLLLARNSHHKNWCLFA